MYSRNRKYRSKAWQSAAHRSSLLAFITIACSAVPALAVDGTWTQTAAGTWSGAANWQGGSIASGTGSIANFTTAAVAVDLDASYTVGQLNFGGSGAWTLAGTGILTLDNGTSAPRIKTDTGVSATISAIIAGSNGFVKDGAGTLTLSGANTYTGTTEIKEGILIASPTQLSGAALTLSGGTLQLSTASAAINKAITVSGTTSKIVSLRGSNTLSGTVTGASDAVLALSAGDRAAAALTIRSDFSAYSGTVVLAKPSEGTAFRLDTTSALASGKNSLWQLDAGTSLFFNAGSNADTYVIELGGLQGGGTLSGGASAGSGSIAYQIGNRGGNTTFSGTIIDGLTKTRLVKVGSGTLTLSGANAYTGTTAVNEGTLLVSGSLGTSTVNIASGASLKVTGSAGGPVNIAAGGALKGAGTIAGLVTAAGANSQIDLRDGAIGTLTLSNGLTLNSGNALHFDFDLATSTVDKIAVTGGAFTYEGTGTTIDITAINSGVAAASTYNLLTLSGTATGTINASNFTLTTASIGGQAAFLSSTGTELQLTLALGLGNATAYWKNGASGNWGTGNFSLNANGTGTVSGIDGATEVHFSATTPTPVATTATLAADQVVKSLTVDASQTAGVTITGTQKISIGAGGITSQAGAGALTINAAEVGLGSIQSWTNHSSSAITVSSTITGAGTGLKLTGTGSGGFYFSGANIYDAGTTIGDATAGAATLHLTGTGSLLSTGAVSIATNSTFDISALTNGGTAIGTLDTLSGATGAKIVLGANGLTVNQAASTAFAGVISGTGSVIKSGTATLTLSGVNTYTGATAVNNGVLALATGGSISASGSVSISADGDLDISQSTGQTIGRLSGAGKVSLGSQTLTVNETADTTFSGEIRDGGITTGTGGGLTKTGTGTLTLSGSNTYTGTTRISAGTLNLTGSLSSGTVTIATGGTLNDVNGGLSATSALNNSGTVVFGADDTIATLTNSGTLNGSTSTLTATTYNLNGGSVINAKLGGGTLNANGAVEIRNTTAATSVNIQTGTTTLTGAERLLDTAAVAISSGATLAIGGAEKIGTLSGAGAVSTNGSVLTVDSGTFSGNIGGTGGLTKSGSGMLSLGGTNSYTGATSVNGGILEVGGSLAGTSVTVGSGGTLKNSGTVSGSVNLSGILGGTGTVQGLVATTSGSTINLSDGAINAKTLSGGLTLAGGSIVHLDLGTIAGSVDQINLAGSVFSGSGTTTLLFTQVGLASQTGSYTLITGAAGGISADNFTVGSLLPGYSTSLSSDGTNLVLTLVASDYASYAVTPNQVVVAAAIEQVVFAPADYSAEFQNVITSLLSMTSQQEAAYDQISPAFHSGALTLASGLSQSTASSLFQNLALRSINSEDASDPYAGDYLWDLWGQASGYFSDGGASLIPGEDFKSGTYLVGANRNITHHTSIGVFGGYGDGTGDFADASSIDLERQFVGGYLTYVNGGFYANAAVGGGSIDYDSKRRIQFGTLDRTATGTTSGEELFAVVGAGYDFQVGNFTVGPQASLQRSSVKLDGFSESGADSLDLALDDTEYTSLRSQIGGRVSYTLRTESPLALVPFVQTFWQHEYEDSQDDIAATLDGGNGPAFAYTSTQGDQDSVIFGAGLSLDLGETFQAVFSYNRDSGNGGSDSFSATANFKF